MILGILAPAIAARPAEFVTPGEMERKSDWVKSHLATTRPSLPFSFVYGGKASSDLLPSWPRTTETTRLDAVRTRRTTTWTDPVSGLQVRCAAVEYADFPAVEWTVDFKNASDRDTGLLEAIQGIDVTLDAWVKRASSCSITGRATPSPPISTSRSSGPSAPAPSRGSPRSGGTREQRRVPVLQPRDARRRADDRGGLAGPVGGVVRARLPGVRCGSRRARSSPIWCSGPARRSARR